jgi:predicted DNA-binding ribbon-helix-helix protein
MTSAQVLDPEIHEDEEAYENLADYHRVAAMHYSQAAKHHTLAADADDHV